MKIYQTFALVLVWGIQGFGSWRDESSVGSTLHDPKNEERTFYAFGFRFDCNCFVSYHLLMLLSLGINTDFPVLWVYFRYNAIFCFHMKEALWETRLLNYSLKEPTHESWESLFIICSWIRPDALPTKTTQKRQVSCQSHSKKANSHSQNMNIIYYLVPSAGQEAMYKCVFRLSHRDVGIIQLTITIKPCIS